MQPRVTSAVKEGKVNHSGSVIDVDEGEHYQAGHHHRILLVEVLTAPQDHDMDVHFMWISPRLAPLKGSNSNEVDISALLDISYH